MGKKSITELKVFASPSHLQATRTGQSPTLKGSDTNDAQKIPLAASNTESFTYFAC